MIFLKLFIGIVFFLLGWVYLYNQNLVLWLNKFAREKFFNDRLILLERKKLSIVFFCFSFVSLYMGYAALVGLKARMNAPNSVIVKTYAAMQDYRAGRYQAAISKYMSILESEPDNLYATKNLAKVYIAKGDKKHAMDLYTRLSRMYPNDTKVQEDIEKLKK